MNPTDSPVTPSAPRPRRWRRALLIVWAVLALALLLSLLGVAVGAWHAAAAGEFGPVNVVINGHSVGGLEHLSLDAMGAGPKFALLLSVVALLVVVTVVLPLTLMAVLAIVIVVGALALVLSVGLPLVAGALALAVVAAPALLVVWLLWRAGRALWRGTASASAPSTGQTRYPPV
jgi:hypothetical protein